MIKSFRLIPQMITISIIGIFIISFTAIAQDKNIDYNLQMAEMNHRTGNCVEALKSVDRFFRKIQVDENQIARAYAVKAMCLERKNKYKDAKHFAKLALDKGFNADSTNSGIFKIAQTEIDEYQDALYLFTKEDYTGAGEKLAALLDPYRDIHKEDQLDLLFLQGRTFAKQKKLKEAYDSFWKLLGINNNYDPPDQQNIETETLHLYNSTKEKYNSPDERFKRNWPFYAGAGVAVALFFILINNN